MNIIIIDDERLALESLAELIDWEAHGYHLAGCLKNGSEALRMMKTLNPDIVITDIRMPIMDGIDLSRELQKDYPHVKVVLLTAYKDFEYAQQALRYGVTEYLLKNQITEEKLLELLERLSGDILKSRQINLAIQHNYYHDLMADISPLDELKPIQKREGALQVLIKIKEPYLLSELVSFQMPEIRLDKAALVEAVAGIGEVKLQQIFGFGQQCWGLLFSTGLPGGQVPGQALLMELYGRMKKYFGELSQFDIAVLYDHGADTPQSMKESYRNMLKYMKYSIFFQSAMPYACRSMEKYYEDVDSNHGYVQAEIAKAKAAIQSGDYQGMNQIFDQLNTYFSKPRFNLGGFRYVFRKMIDLLDAIRANNNLGSLMQYIALHQEEMEGISSVWEIWNWIVCEFNKIGIQIGSNPGSIKDKKILHSLDYIHKNYMKKITVKSVAESVDLSEVYFGNLFKKETGYTFLEYLTMHRMEVAKYLIGEGKFKVYEIAEMTGYTSPQYFSQIFQKSTGYMPNEYSRRGE